MRGWVHHIDLTVSDLGRSGPFYEAVLGFLGYRQGIRLAREKRPHNRYSCGLHHLAWVAGSRADVDRMHRLLLEIEATVFDPPVDYPDYREGYYAVFFADPDGLKLEFVHTPER